MSNEMSSTEFLKTLIPIAEHFGFRGAHSYRKDPERLSCNTSTLLSPARQQRIATDDYTECIFDQAVDTFYAHNLNAMNRPVLFYSINETPLGDLAFSLHAYNVPKSIAEALIIQVNRVFADVLGYDNHTVRINSIGDTDSHTRYTKEITNFLRKRLEYLPVTTRELMKQHVFLALLDLHKNEHDLSYTIPSPLEFLSDQSRKHFRDIVEFLDTSNTPYEIDARLLGHHECYSDTLFTVDINHEQPSVTLKGGRYDELLYRKSKKRAHAVGSVAILHERSVPSRLPRITTPTPDVYVIQLGFEPKIKCLLLLEELRKVGVSVMQDIANDSLSAQLRHAEESEVPHVIIIGQKEYVDGTVILRNMKARTQESIPPHQAIKQLQRVVKKQ